MTNYTRCSVPDCGGQVYIITEEGESLCLMCYNNNSQNHYYDYSFKGVRIDPYRIFDVYGITNPCQQHAIKKLLRAGRSVKELEVDIDEVIKTLGRWKEMLHE